MTRARSRRALRVSISGWSGYFVFLYLYRTLASILGQTVVLRITSVGDTWSYQQGVFAGDDVQDVLTLTSILDFQSTIFSTYLTARIGGFFNTVFFGSPILINIGFHTITFVGLVYLIKSVDGTARRYLAFLILLPSFTVWTSIASKEAIVVAAMAILSGYLLRIYSGRNLPDVLVLASVAIVALYKPYYLAAIAYALAAAWICGKVSQKSLVALVGGLVSLFLLYLLRDTVDGLANSVQRLMFAAPLGGSSRFEPFFVEQYDVFYKALPGMALAFVGPTASEILRTPLNVVVFIESTGLILVLLAILLRRLHALPVYSLVVGIFTMFWIMFPSYPFGVINVGTAVRYRTGWLVVVFAVVAALMSRPVYVRWRFGRRPGAAAIPASG
jgi:hypothetical protein